MDYKLLQDAVVTHLQPFVTAGIAEVIRLPESEAERKDLLPTKARFTVIYAGSEYTEAKSTAQISQDEKIFIQILVESSFLYGAKGIYSLTSILKKALTGFKAQGSTRFQVTKHHTIGQPEADKKNNVWQYQVIFQANALHVEDFTEDISVLLKKITFIDRPDNEDFIIPDPDIT